MTAPAPCWPASLLVVGCGNMGGAMLAGWLAGGVAPARFTVLDPSVASVPAGVALARGAQALAGRRFDAVLLGVKPQLLGAVAPTIAALCDDTALLSILAGVRLETLRRVLPGASGWVRVMPNLAAALGRSPIALAALALDDRRRADVASLLAPLGAPEWLDEALFDAATALAGCGPAFLYRFIDALAAGGAALGLPMDQARRLALASAEGASALAAASPDTPADLARKVASPGGATQAGLAVLDEDDALARLIAATMAAAAVRSAELAAVD